MEQSRIKKMSVSALLAAILTLYIFLLVPFTLYIGNINEFTVSFAAMAQLYIPAIVSIVFFAGFLGMLLPESVYNRYAAFLAIIGILTWIQGNLLVWDYGLLDGRAIDWSINAWRGWLEALVWVGGLISAIYASRSGLRRIFWLAVSLCVLQLAFFTYNWVVFAPDLSKKTIAPDNNHAVDKYFQFSSKKNVLHIIADGFQSDVFEDILNDGEEGERVATVLDGFTFYRDHLGAFPYTHMSIPAILGGKIYRNHVPIDSFLQSAIGKHSILNHVYDAGYDVDMVVPGGLVYMYKKGRYTNLTSVPRRMRISEAESKRREAAKLLDLSLFRTSPHLLKKKIYNDQVWLIQSFLEDKKHQGLQFFTHITFLRNLHENISISRDKPVYKYLHLMLSHNPIVANKHCGYAGRVLPTIRETVIDQARCSLEEVLKLFEEMKKAGIYDDTLIILMADHGAWVPPEKMTGIPASDGRSISVMNPQIVALSQPLLAIKPPGERGALRISNAPSWIIDTAPTIADYMELDTGYEGRSVRELEQDETRERRHLVYEYQRSDWKDKYLSPIQEFIVSGKGIDSSSWHEVAIHLPGGVEQKNKKKSSLWRKVDIRE